MKVIRTSHYVRKIAIAPGPGSMPYNFDGDNSDGMMWTRQKGNFPQRGGIPADTSTPEIPVSNEIPQDVQGGHDQFMGMVDENEGMMDDPDGGGLGVLDGPDDAMPGDELEAQPAAPQHDFPQPDRQDMAPKEKAKFIHDAVAQAKQSFGDDAVALYGAAAQAYGDLLSDPAVGRWFAKTVANALGTMTGDYYEFNKPETHQQAQSMLQKMPETVRGPLTQLLGL